MLSFFLSKNKNIVVLIFLVILSSSFMSFSSTKFSVTFKEVGETIIYPFRWVVVTIWDGISSIINSFEERNELRDKLKRKEKQIIKYREKANKYTLLVKENEHLKKLIQYRKQETLNTEVAKILSRDPEENFSSLTLDKGSNNGFEIGMPVFAYMNENKGIVGIIAECSPFTSKVKTFRNRDFSIGVYLPYSGVHGIVQGVGDNKNVMSLLYIDKDIKINMNEVVVSSSEGQLFPANIFLGNIRSIDVTDKTRLTHKAYIKPYIHLSKIKEVFVVKKIFGQNQNEK